METVKQNVCDKCGAPMAWSSRTNKPYCSAKCWLNEKPNTAPIQVAAKMPVMSQQSSFYVAYAKDLCIEMLRQHGEHVRAGKAEPIEVSKLMNEACNCIKIAMDEFK